ncbi:MAG: hypothetical protein IT196_05380 [Acidimicrobiales bacterium]|nr:hypothetical protein [Acidimicrobiales bacterium]
MAKVMRPRPLSAAELRQLGELMLLMAENAELLEEAHRHLDAIRAELAGAR